MPTFSMNIVNRNFASSNSLAASNPEEARSEALRSALQMGSEEVIKGNSFFAAEIGIQCGEKIIERMAVAIGASTMQLPSSAFHPKQTLAI